MVGGLLPQGRSLSVADQADLLAQAAEAIRRVQEAITGTAAPVGPTVVGLVEKWQAAHPEPPEEQEAKHRAWQIEGARLRRVLETKRADGTPVFGGEKVAESITLADADEYRTIRRGEKAMRGGYEGNGALTSASTRNRELALLSRVLNWSRKRRSIAANPLADLEKEAEPAGRQTAYTEAEIEKILAAASDQARPIFLVAFDCGVRRDEVRTLKRNQVDREARELVLVATKNGRARRVPITARAFEAIRGSTSAIGCPYLFANPDTQKPWDPHTLWKWFKRACADAGVEGVADETPTLHNTRHSFARNAARRGVPLSTVKTWGGWRTWEAFDRYNLTEQAHHEEGRRKMEEGIKRETAALTDGERKGPQATRPEDERKDDADKNQTLDFVG